MKIVFDINHPAHINFFKNSIYELRKQGYKILICGLNRGKVPSILKHEFKDYDIRVIGKHRGTIFSIIFEANIFKFFKMLFEVIKEKPDFGLGVGSFILGACMKIVGKKNIQFDDDPESSQNIFFEKLTATEIHMPKYVNISESLESFNCLKEWAYLSPAYFTPAIIELEKYNIKAQQYIFIREVSTGSLNYANQQSNMIATFARDLPHNYKVLLSLEDKSTINQYPSDWILLKEPLNDIHSLIYFSKILISSGDSMAREGAMLGVTSIYCGTRKMAANKVMIDKGMLFHKDVENVPQFVEQIINRDIKIEEQDKFRERLKDEWIDMTEFIIRQIKKYG